jgi:soluble lytic murein transglycosylase-like protein
MKDLSNTYVHRGDVVRRRAHARKLWILAGATVAAVTMAREPEPRVADAAPLVLPASSVLMIESSGDLERHMEELRLERAHEARAARVAGFAGRYGITRELAAAIHDIALDEGIEPELAFRLVKAESEFKARATSPVGAVGLTQVMPATARYFDSRMTRQRLYDPHTNLRVGFRYLRGLIREYDGNVRLALLAYNRGPVAVQASLAMGVDPANGYEKIVMGGYRGRGVVD